MLLLQGGVNFLDSIYSKNIQAPSKNYNWPSHLFRRLKLCLIGKTSPQIKEQLSSPIIQKLVINLVDNELLSRINYSLQIEQMLVYFKTKLLQFPFHSHSQGTCFLLFSPQYCCQPHCLVNINKTKFISTQSHKTENPHNQQKQIYPFFFHLIAAIVEQRTWKCVRMWVCIGDNSLKYF